MDSDVSTLNANLSPAIQIDKYAQQFLDRVRGKLSHKFISSATHPNPNPNQYQQYEPTYPSPRDLLKNLGASLLQSIQLQGSAAAAAAAATGGVGVVQRPLIIHEPNSLIAVTASATAKAAKAATAATAVTAVTATGSNMEFAPNHVVIDTTFSAIDELQKQLDYDKFMNEVWIGVVLTLILISMIFCICSCFLYHQFRTWKRNYHSTVARSSSNDNIESMKLHSILHNEDDPVPEYTLVSGLPTYEAALEQMQQKGKPTTPTTTTTIASARQSHIIVYHPSVFEVFEKNEKTTGASISSASASASEITAFAQHQQQQQQQQQQQRHQLMDVNPMTPLLATATTATSTSTSTSTTIVTADVEYSDNHNGNGHRCDQQMKQQQQQITSTAISSDPFNDDEETLSKF